MTQGQALAVGVLCGLSLGRGRPCHKLIGKVGWFEGRVVGDGMLEGGLILFEWNGERYWGGGCRRHAMVAVAESDILEALGRWTSRKALLIDAPVRVPLFRRPPARETGTECLKGYRR